MSVLSIAVKQSLRRFGALALLLAMAGCGSEANTPPPPAGPVLVKASVADSRVTAFNEDNYVNHPRSVTPRGQLFVFLPGTREKPTRYTKIVDKAASMGYHAVGVMYSNDSPLLGLCRDAVDLVCYADIRNEIIDAKDRSALVTIPRENSIEGRLIALLQYLEKTYPQQGWGGYLDSAGVPAWSKIAFAGHSQGGGHAALIGKNQSVARVLMFSWHDYNANQAKIAPWLALPGTTPSDRYYGFHHQLDDALRFDPWEKLAVPALKLGTPLRIDGATSFASTRAYYTARTGAASAHNSTVIDEEVPLDAGKLAWDALWEHMLR